MGLHYLLARRGAGAPPFRPSALFHSDAGEEIPELEICMTPICMKEEAAPRAWTAEGLPNIGSLVMARGKAAVPGVQCDVDANGPRSRATVRLADAAGKARASGPRDPRIRMGPIADRPQE